MINKTKNGYAKTLLGLTIFLNVNTAMAQTCVKAPDCAEIGFTKTAADCTGKTILKCPFDTNQVYCPGYEESTKTYKVGDMYYKDGVAAGVVSVITDGGLHGIIVSTGSVSGTSVAEVRASCNAKTTAGLEWSIATCQNSQNVKDIIHITADHYFVDGGCIYKSCVVSNSEYMSECRNAGGYCQASF